MKADPYLMKSLQPLLGRTIESIELRDMDTDCMYLSFVLDDDAEINMAYEDGEDGRGLYVMEDETEIDDEENKYQH